MVDYCVTNTCRHVFISKYFTPGEALNTCGTNCDVCTVTLMDEKAVKRDVLERQELEKEVDGFENSPARNAKNMARGAFQTARELNDKEKRTGLGDGFQTARELSDKELRKGLGDGFQTAREYQSKGKKKAKR
jgi:superfamily II DNA helicase RecQ